MVYARYFAVLCGLPLVFAACASNNSARSLPDTGGANSGGTAAQASGAGGAPAGGTGGVSGGTGGSGGSAGTTVTCAAPNIDGFEQWLASGEGVTQPKTGSLLQPLAPGYVAKISFVSDWCTAAIWLNNAFGVETDLTQSPSFELDYSATSDFYVQLRPGGAEWNGGDQYAFKIPNSNGARTQLTVPFTAAGWQSLFAAPKLSFADTLKRASGFVVVGNTQNDLSFYGLRVAGFTPPCK